MTTPHHLAATAAAWSLQAALAALETAAKAAIAAAVDGDRSGDIAIPSQVFGRRHGLGGHGDPTADAALGAWAPGRPDPHAQALGDLLRALDPIAGLLPGAPGMDPVTRIRRAIPAMSPLAAERTAQALRRLDEVARRTLRIGPARTPLVGVPCPAPGCGQRRLEVTTCGPEPDRAVMCAACAGIWPRALVLGAVAGVA
ncbi:hypothetical protein [Micromonospora okii]|uniref:hypothetical protein n=1 Tax=Micromonospora okii TaxID=1182970 RepID=UPI001E599C52|nr:hypothetical protein [Micromonospora okii]